MPILPNGLAVYCTKHHPGSRSRTDNVRANKEKRHRLTAKLGSELLVPDLRILSAQYRNEWSTLADKGYRGAAELLKVITATKNPPRGKLSVHDQGRVEILILIAHQWKRTSDDYVPYEMHLIQNENEMRFYMILLSGFLGTD